MTTYKEKTNYTIEQRIKYIEGTFALENMCLSEDTKNNIRLYATGKISYDELLNKIKKRFMK